MNVNGGWLLGFTPGQGWLKSILKCFSHYVQALISSFFGFVSLKLKHNARMLAMRCP